MYWFTENAFQPLMLGLLAAFVCGAFSFMLKNKVLLWVTLGIVAATISIVVIEQVIETDSERVTKNLLGISAALSRNDLESVLGFISDSSPQLKAEAKREMRVIEFESVTVFGLSEPEIDLSTDPPTAIIEFNGRVSADATRSSFHAAGVGVARFKLYYEKTDDGDWKITRYEQFRITQNDMMRGW